VTVGADDQQPVLALVVVLDEADGVEPGVPNAGRSGGLIKTVVSRLDDAAGTSPSGRCCAAHALILGWISGARCGPRPFSDHDPA